MMKNECYFYCFTKCYLMNKRRPILKHANGHHDSICKVLTSKPRVIVKCCSCNSSISNSKYEGWESNLAQPVFKCVKCTNPDNTWDYDNILCLACVGRHRCRAKKVKMRIRLSYCKDSVAPFVVPE